MGPLHGYRVIELGIWVAGPTARRSSRSWTRSSRVGRELGEHTAEVLSRETRQAAGL